MKQFIVVRSRFIKESEIHSTEYFEDEHSAIQRFSNIWAADVNNDKVTWNGVFLCDTSNLQYVKKFEINDLREDKNTFFMLLRFLEKDSEMTHSLQYFYPDYVDPSIEYMNAVKRWFTVIATDLNDDEVTANGAILFDSLAEVREQRFFKRAKPQPEEPGEETTEEPNEENGDEE